MTTRIDSMEITDTLTGDAVVDDAHDNPPRRTTPLSLPNALIAENDPHLREVER